MSNKKIAVAILWHQHQPFYKNGADIYQMPWVRFHSTKDYLDMMLVLQEFPKIKQNVNLVPSLLYQILDYANNGARDNIWKLTETPAAELTADDKKSILSDFFLANVNNMIKPYPKYYEMYLKFKWHLKNQPIERRIEAFSVQDFLDLQVWYNLTWIGVESRKRPEISHLFKKGKKFSEQDKKILLSESRKIMGEIIPLHKKLWDEGQLDLSTTPYYHPILPLLCDNYIAQESSPHLPLPHNHFSFPEDAENQVIKGLELFEQLFNRRPKGMWPSEGSVSLQALEIIARQGIEWVATDEGILSRSIREQFSQNHIYRPYRLATGQNEINVFFRDHYLSDAIGFVYSNWPADRAVEDFRSRLLAIRRQIVDERGENALDAAVVPIILDGENCWEYYEGDGKPFLRALYRALSDDASIETITLTEALKRTQNPATLDSLFPGSWINSNFNIWIGADEDNKAWDILFKTREFLVKQEDLGVHSEELLEKAWEKIYIAEGSDWNWWYGDDHSSANDMEFDQLYREHLIEVYQLLGVEVPPELYQTIKRKHFDRFVSSRPKNFINPVVDGKSTHFYEWVGAAVYELEKTTQSAMHQVTRIMEKLYVGFNAQKLFLRLDFSQPPNRMTEFYFSFRAPNQKTFVVSPLRGVLEKIEIVNEIKQKSVLEPTFRIEKILEVAIPFDALDVKPGDLLGFQVELKLNGQPLEKYPHISLIEIEVPTRDFDLTEWSA